MYYWCVKFFFDGSPGERYVWAKSGLDAMDKVCRELASCNIVSCTWVNVR